jgi:hypothetical protein
VDTATPEDLAKLNCPKVKVFHSACITYYAPSDESGIPGMRREYVRCTPNWRKVGPRRDCVLINTVSAHAGFPEGVEVVRLRLLFSFTEDGKDYPCALVEWFKAYGDVPDELTGMWRVVPEMENNRRKMTVVHLETFIRAAHLCPDFGREVRPFPAAFDYRIALDAFEAYYLNKYIDGHTFELMMLT